MLLLPAKCVVGAPREKEVPGCNGRLGRSLAGSPSLSRGEGAATTAKPSKLLRLSSQRRGCSIHSMLFNLGMERSPRLSRVPVGLFEALSIIARGGPQPASQAPRLALHGLLIPPLSTLGTLLLTQTGKLRDRLAELLDLAPALHFSRGKISAGGLVRPQTAFEISERCLAVDVGRLDHPLAIGEDDASTALLEPEPNMLQALMKLPPRRGLEHVRAGHSPDVLAEGARARAL